MNPSCPYCFSNETTKNGFSKNNVQRYRCNNCHKSFCANTTKVEFRSRKDNAIWYKFNNCLAKGFTLKESAKICGISVNTATDWKKKIKFSNSSTYISQIQKEKIYQYNEKNKADGLALLDNIIDNSVDIVFFDPQYRGLLDKMKYGNQNRQIDRIALPQMTTEIIRDFLSQIDRVLKKDGYLFLWIDRFHLCEGIGAWLNGLDLNFHTVDTITWDKQKLGMGYRTRKTAENLMILCRHNAPTHWTDHSIPDIWPEKVKKNHPHSKPVELQRRLILAVSQDNPNAIVVDPAAGGYSVLEATRLAGRNFLGCDVEFG